MSLSALRANMFNNSLLVYAAVPDGAVNTTSITGALKAVSNYITCWKKVSSRQSDAVIGFVNLSFRNVCHISGSIARTEALEKSTRHISTRRLYIKKFRKQRHLLRMASRPLQCTILTKQCLWSTFWRCFPKYGAFSNQTSHVYTHIRLSQHERTHYRPTRKSEFFIECDCFKGLSTHLIQIPDMCNLTKRSLSWMVFIAP